VRHGVVLFTSDRGITPARAAKAAEAAGFECFYVPEQTISPSGATRRTRGPERKSCRTTATCGRWTLGGTEHGGGRHLDHQARYGGRAAG
jgi:hypothetical protein